jgi:hypothetical protein
MIKEIIMIFVLGIVGDILATLYYLFVGKLQALPASLMTIFITLLNFFIIEKIVVSTNWIFILAYAVGSSLGCFTIIISQKRKLRKNIGKPKKKKGKIREYLF